MEGNLNVVINKKLKQELIQKLSDYYPSMYVYQIRTILSSEIEDYARYCASQFMGRATFNFLTPFRRENDSKVIDLPWETKMRIYDNSNAIVIKRKMNPLDNLIIGDLNLKQQSEIVTNLINDLDLDRYRLQFEKLKLQFISNIKAGGINVEGERAPEVLCRIVGEFKRYINSVPVFGTIPFLIKIAANRLLESITIHWRPIQERPIDNPRIINPETAAEKILTKLNSFLPNKELTLELYEPIFFALGYYSKPKREVQKYMQPVYLAIFRPVGMKTFNPMIVLPATNHIYENLDTILNERKFKKKPMNE